MLFTDFTSEERNIIEDASSQHSFSTDTTIISEGDAGDSMFIVKSGLVQVRKDLSDEQHKKLKQIGPDGFFGEMSFLGTCNRSATVIVLEDCELLELSVEAFASISEKHPDLAAKVYKNIAVELAERLKKNTEDLKKAVIWAVQGMDH